LEVSLLAAYSTTEVLNGRSLIHWVDRGDFQHPLISAEDLGYGNGAEATEPLADLFLGQMAVKELIKRHLLGYPG
jgi:hypothetical protein